jgi:hypothetical protein
MREGVRIKNPLIKNTSSEDLVNFFTKEGFLVTGVGRTARSVTVLISHQFMKPAPEEGSVCCTYPAEIKISDDGVVLRWSGISSRQYYHLNTKHKPEIDSLEAKAVAAWSRFESGK